MEKTFYVYILSNKKSATLYIGVTSNLLQRIWQHKNHVVPEFTDKYHLDRLVYYEQHNTPDEAIRREKRLKLWQRKWKIELIEKHNPDWQDLYPKIV